jgi:predicted aldo/keto reductase-like oxidoreductase
MTRFIGMTSHTDGAVLQKAIEHHDLDCVQMALNPTLNGGFHHTALPAANKKNLGVIAMKVMGQDFILGPDAGSPDPALLLRYSMSLPVTTAVVGMPQVAHLNHNLEVARNYAPPSTEELDRLRRTLEPLRIPMEKRLVGHLDGPSRLEDLFWV